MLTLDVATRTGWAAGPSGGTPVWGERDFADDAGTGAIVGKFRFWLGDMIQRFRPAVVAFESPYVPRVKPPKFIKVNGGVEIVDPGIPINPLTLRRLMGMCSQVEATCWELRIRYYEATPSEITAYFVGRGHGRMTRDKKKLLTIAECARLGWDATENAADALALWSYAEGMISPEASMARRANAGQELPLYSGDAPRQDRIGRRPGRGWG